MRATAMNETKLSLALDRTPLAAERTLMGWIRTSFSMMTFGFTFYKVIQEMGQISAAFGVPVWNRGIGGSRWRASAPSP